MSEAIKYLGFNDRWLMILGIPIISAIITIINFSEQAFGSEALVCFSIGLIYTSVFWVSARYFLIKYHKRYDHYIFTIWRLVFVVFWVAVIYLAIKIFVSLIILMLFDNWKTLIFSDPLRQNLTSVTLIFGTFFLYEGIYYFNKSRLIEIEKNKLEKVTAEQKLSTLKNQVNPHFLFNSLNTLVTIIPEEPELAIKFVQELSKSYRKILEVRDEKLITLKTELDSLESYMYLLKTRFQGKILFENTLAADVLNQFILPLSLQILIENAVKHNITSTSKPLKIKIYNEDDFVVVENNLQKKDQIFSTTKLGLANIKSRYQLLINKNIFIVESKDSFKVKLPIIKNKEA